MDNDNPYPYINTILLIVQICTTIMVAVIALNSLWISWFNSVKLKAIGMEIEKLGQENKESKSDMKSIRKRVDTIPTLIATSTPTPWKDSSGNDGSS